MAAPTRRALRPPSSSATTWCATNLLTASRPISTCSMRASRCRGEPRDPTRDRQSSRIERRSDPSCAASAPRCPSRIMKNADSQDGRDHRRMDRPAHRHPRSATSRAERDDAPLGARRRARSARHAADSRRRRSTSSCWRPRRPDNTFPATAGRDPGRLGMHQGSPSTCRRCAPASSTRVATADATCAAGSKRALVIGAETFSRILDWNDRSTCVLFGDGAGAVVLEAQRAARHPSPTAACWRAACAPTARHKDKLYVDGGPLDHRRSAICAWRAGGLQARGRHDHRRRRGRRSPRPASPPPTSTGSCRTRPTSASSTLPPRSSASPHEKVVMTVDLHGNTSAASVPLALSSRSRTAASRRAIWCCWRRWAAASPGARRCCAGSRHCEACAAGEAISVRERMSKLKEIASLRSQ